MVLNNFVEKEIDGTKYKFCLRNRCIFQAERELANQNLLTALSNQPMNMGDMFVLFKWALIGGGHNLTEDEAYEVFISSNFENTYVGTFNIILEAIQASGLLGNGQTKNKKAASKA